MESGPRRHVALAAWAAVSRAPSSDDLHGPPRGRRSRLARYRPRQTPTELTRVRDGFGDGILGFACAAPHDAAGEQRRAPDSGRAAGRRFRRRAVGAEVDDEADAHRGRWLVLADDELTSTRAGRPVHEPRGIAR